MGRSMQRRPPSMGPRPASERAVSIRAVALKGASPGGLRAAMSHGADLFRGAGPSSREAAQ
eukprot:1429677-Lingulodinium_polyedra.AAC.1